MKSSYPRPRLQLPTRTYVPPARTNTQTDLCSGSSHPSVRLLMPMLARVGTTLVRSQTEA